MTKFLTLSGILMVNLMFFSASEVSAREAFRLGAEKSSDQIYKLADPLIPGKAELSFEVPEPARPTGDADLPLVSGDINGDGVVDGEDLGIFLSNYGQEAVDDLSEADFNRNGVLDSSDYVMLLSMWNQYGNDQPDQDSILGDLNLDSRVDNQDLGVFLAHYGEEAYGALANADFDLNGILNHTDLVILLDLIGSSSDSDGFR